MKLRNQWIVMAVMIMASFYLVACTQTSAMPAEEPAYVEPIEGSDLKRVVLTERAAERLDIQTVSVREEQIVRERTAGGEVVTLPEASADNTTAGGVWVRVFLNEHDLNKVDRSRPVRILSLDDDEEDDDDETNGWMAEPDEGPFDDDGEDGDEANAALYYVVDGAAGLVTGQRVLVELALAGSGMPQKIVPYAAVIYDLYGGTWVYTHPEPLVFVRHPISVDYIDDDLAVLLDGPPADMQVVTVGVAELYGTETGVGK
jgi:hypothetical protein